MMDLERNKELIAEVLNQPGAEGSSLKDFDGTFPSNIASNFTDLEGYGEKSFYNYIYKG